MSQKNQNPLKTHLASLLNWFAKDNDGRADFAHRYGTAFVVLLIATVIVAFKAASADFEVLQAMMYNVQKSPKAAFAESLSLAIVLHALMFVAGSICFSNLIHGNVKKSMDDRIQTGFWAVIMAGCLGVSLYLSINTDQYAKHQADSLLQSAIANKTSAEGQVMATFSAEQQRIIDQYNADRTALNDAYAAKLAAENAAWEAKIARATAKASDYEERYKRAGSTQSLKWMESKAQQIRRDAIPALQAQQAAARGKIESAKAAELQSLLDTKNKNFNATKSQQDGQYAAVAAAGTKSVEEIRADINKAAAVLRYRNITFSALGMILLAIMHFMYRGITSPTLVKPKAAKAKTKSPAPAPSKSRTGFWEKAKEAILNTELPISAPAEAVATPPRQIGFNQNAVATPSNAAQPTAANPEKSVATSLVQAKYLERARKSYLSDLRAWEAKERSGSPSAPKNVERLTAEIKAIDAQLNQLK